MTRIIRVLTCDRCPYAHGSRGCTHPDALVEVAGVLTIHMFDDYFVIPDWCPLEQVAPDWRPPTTIDLNGPPRCTGETGHCHPGAASSKAGGSLRCGPNPRIGSRRDQINMSPMSPLSGPDITSRRPVYLAHHRTTNEPQNLERSQ